MGIDYRRPFIPEKRLGFEGYPFAQPISVSQKWSPLSVLLAHLMLAPFLVFRLTLILTESMSIKFKSTTPSLTEEVIVLTRK